MSAGHYLVMMCPCHELSRFVITELYLSPVRDKRMKPEQSLIMARLPDEDIHPVATGPAAQTVAEHQDPQDLVFWSGWVCHYPRVVVCSKRSPLDRIVLSV